ncbi:MAG TPA: carbon monoxide dehydrogenase, partial [Acidimicrobiaceae bacterium]|nr:carbon monoxide dehydrogenase [Acidimicrobiaceae bacterium]
MPGAQLTEIDGEEFKGQVKVKVGPITAQYKGAAKFKEKDESQHRLVLDATGRDTRGAGNAAAEVTAEMTSDGDGTKIVITTDLKVTGKVAQFGRGVMADVSEKLIGQFVESLEQKLVESNEREVATPTTSESDSATADDDAIEDNSGPRKVNMPEPEPVDLLDTAGAPLFKRFGPFALVALVLVLLRRRKR